MSPEDLEWARVTCRDCGRSYTCTPEDDYYEGGVTNPGPDEGVCLACLMKMNGMNPETTKVLTIDENGEIWDPRDLAVRENFEAKRGEGT